MEWDPDHHRVSFPGLFQDSIWAYTSSRRPGYTGSGYLGRMMGYFGWEEGKNHEAEHIPRPRRLSTDQMKIHVLRSPKVIQAVQTYAAATGKDLRKVQADVASILNVMAADMDYSSVRTLGYTLRKAWRQLYEGPAPFFLTFVPYFLPYFLPIPSKLPSATRKVSAWTKGG